MFLGLGMLWDEEKTASIEVQSGVYLLAAAFAACFALRAGHVFQRAAIVRLAENDEPRLKLRRSIEDLSTPSAAVKSHITPPVRRHFEGEARMLAADLLACDGTSRTSKHRQQTDGRTRIRDDFVLRRAEASRRIKTDSSD